MWTWERLTDPIMGAVFDRPMKSLENELGIAAKTMPVQSKARTTDATVTTLHTQAIPVDTTLTLSGYVTARRTGGSAGTANDGAGYRVEFVAKNSAGTAAVIGSSVNVIGESQAGWDVSVSASSGAVLVRVTGAASNSLSWVGSFKTLSVKE